MAVPIYSVGGPGGPPEQGPFTVPVHTVSTGTTGNPRGFTARRSPINLHGTIALPPPINSTATPPTSTQPTPPPYTGYGNEPLEYPESGNIAPSTDPYAYIDPTTGDVVSSTPGTSTIDAITAWVQANPLLALGLAAAAVFLLMEMFDGGHSRRRR